jgi:poly(beta-D-mannuronate) lyase
MRFIEPVIGAFALCLALVFSLGASAGALRPPFEVPHGTAAITSAMMAACPAAPEPPADLPHDSRYQDDDATHSKVDPVKQAAYDKAIKPLRSFQSKIVEAANDAFADAKNVKKAACVLAGLKAWADKDAMVTLAVDSQSQFNRDQAADSFGLAYLQVSGYAVEDATVRPAIAAWLRKLATGTADYYDHQAGTMSRANNHRYFGALAVAAAAVAADDQASFAWAMHTYETAVCTASADGALPMEMKRGSRARYYQAFALGPLVLLAEFGEANGIATYAKCQGAIHRVVAFSLASLDDPSAVEALAGEAQIDLPDGKAPGSLVTWLAPYARRFPDKPAAGEAARIGKMSSTALGGNLGLIFGFDRG